MRTTDLVATEILPVASSIATASKFSSPSSYIVCIIEFVPSMIVNAVPVM